MDLNPALTFDRYVASSARAAAPAACRALAGRVPGAARWLCLCGPPGVGKTHLLHAMGHAWRERQPRARMAVRCAARLGEELVEAVRRDTVRAWQAHYEALDVLFVDDLHALARRPATALEVGALLGRRLAAGRSVACAMTSGPARARTVVRLLALPSGGRIVRLRALAEGHLVRVLERAAGERAVEAREAVLRRLASTSRGDVRTALGALTRWQLQQALASARPGRGSACA